jgi:carboxymethylenebutenolidase
MCYRTDARAPLPPIAGGAGVETSDLTLTSADGTPFAAFSARTDRNAAPGIVILPDVRGLHDFYKDLAIRFGEAGVHATAFDYFGRTAGMGPREDDFDYWPHVQKTTPDSIAADVRAAVLHVRSPEGGGAHAVFTVGFCFGGRNSFNQATRGHDLAGVIGFYGRVAKAEAGDQNAPTELASSYECPVLGLFGGADQGITSDAVEAFQDALDAAAVDNEIVTYEGAPHSFFDRAFDQFEKECDDAWRRVLAFIDRNAKR